MVTVLLGFLSSYISWHRLWDSPSIRPAREERTWVWIPKKASPLILARVLGKGPMRPTVGIAQPRLRGLGENLSLFSLTILASHWTQSQGTCKIHKAHWTPNRINSKKTMPRHTFNHRNGRLSNLKADKASAVAHRATRTAGFSSEPRRTPYGEPWRADSNCHSEHYTQRKCREGKWNKDVLRWRKETGPAELLKKKC